MAIFPLLNSGAVAQYPLPLTFRGTAEVIAFLDGSDQRFIRQAKPLRAWEIQVTSLNEDELSRIELFFESLDGQYQPFDFPDPYSGVTVPNCLLGASDLVTSYTAVDAGSASIWVMETNGIAGRDA